MTTPMATNTTRRRRGLSEANTVNRCTFLGNLGT
jgi:hypothetical protein